MKIKRSNSSILKKFTVGPLEENCYIVGDPNTKDACIIDPGAEPRRLKGFLQKEGLTLKFILNTHGHGDHIGANGSFGVPIYIHSLDADFLTDPSKNLSGNFGLPISSPKAGRLFEDGDRIPLADMELEIIHTPGHTPGSVSIRLDDVIFTGDTLFRGSVGRTDLAYGDDILLLKSIREKLLVLSDDTVIYPGHGGESTIGEERKSNPFLV